MISAEQPIWTHYMESENHTDSTNCIHKEAISFSKEGNYVEMKKCYLSGIEKGCSTCMHKLAYYYQCVDGNYEEMIKYYLMSIEKGNTASMYNLGIYYDDYDDCDKGEKYLLMAEKKGLLRATNALGIHYYNKGNYEEMKKHFLLAIEKGDDMAMVNLGACYKSIYSDDEQMERYYLMAIEKGNTTAMHNLAHHYYTMADYDQMKKYYLMAIEKGYADSMLLMGIYFKRTEINKESSEKYLLMAIDHGSKKAFDLLERIYTEIGNGNIHKLMQLYYKYKSLKDMPNINNIPASLDSDTVDFIANLDPSKTGLPENHTLIILNKALRAQIDLLELHFKYMPDGDGFTTAKKDFLETINPV